MFSLPKAIKISRFKACYTVRDGAGRSLACVYFEPEPSRRAVAGLLSPEEALAVAKFIARALTDAGQEADNTRTRGGQGGQMADKPNLRLPGD